MTFLEDFSFLIIHFILSKENFEDYWFFFFSSFDVLIFYPCEYEKMKVKKVKELLEKFINVKLLWWGFFFFIRKTIIFISF